MWVGFKQNMPEANTAAEYVAGGSAGLAGETCPWQAAGDQDIQTDC